MGLSLPKELLPKSDMLQIYLGRDRDSSVQFHNYDTALCPSRVCDLNYLGMIRLDDPLTFSI